MTVGCSPLSSLSVCYQVLVTRCEWLCYGTEKAGESSLRQPGEHAIIAGVDWVARMTMS